MYFHIRNYFALRNGPGALIRCALIALLMLIIVSTPASAYIAGAKYWGSLTINYYIDPVVDSALFSGASTLIEAGAQKWNTMRVNLVRTTNSAHPNQVTATNFVTNPPPCLGSRTSAKTYAVNCIDASDWAVNDNQIYYNSNRSHWIFTNSSPPDVNWSVSPSRQDMQMAGTHEFGHSIVLHDDPPRHSEAMMYNNGIAKRELAEDDKHGATMLYGARTSWEPGFAEGQQHRIVPNLALNVTGYFSGLAPELSPVTSANEFGVQPYDSRFERMAGSSQSGYSYVYFSLFTYEEDDGWAQNWLIIKPGMHLKWLQYNYQQATASVDLRLRNPRGEILYLRDVADIKDQFGVRVHPAARGSYATGKWHFFDVDLTSLGYGDWRIDRWMLAYDNGNNGYIGQFRFYFDNLRVEY